jgi:elongation factor 1-gamma
MSFGKLFASPGGPRTTVLEVVAKANGLDIEVINSSNADLHADHLKAHPLGKVPAFLGEDGFALHEIIAIAIYCESNLAACSP